MSGFRSESARIVIPPAASICIMSDVPERGSPETMVIIWAEYLAESLNEYVPRS